MKKKTYLYKGFERFWHWSQALLIFFLALTGMEIHRVYTLFGFENGVVYHNIAAIAFIVLIIFSIFWHFVTGEWKQYIPTTRFLKAQFNYYISGIFKGAPHPTHKTVYNKFNPLQRFIYLGLKILIIPVIVLTGLVYMLYLFPENPLHVSELEIVATLHTLGAFILLAFVIAHVYLTTTGDHPLTSIRAMLTGWEVIDVDEKEERMHYLTDAVKNSSTGYYRINARGIITDVNDAWLKMYRYNNRDEIVGKHFSETRTQEELKQLENTFDRILKGGSVSGTPVTRRCKDGSPGTHLLTANPVYEDEKNVGMEGFITDISQLNLEKSRNNTAD